MPCSRRILDDEALSVEGQQPWLLPTTPAGQGLRDRQRRQCFPPRPARQHCASVEQVWKGAMNAGRAVPVGGHCSQGPLQASLCSRAWHACLYMHTNMLMLHVQLPYAGSPPEHAGGISAAGLQSGGRGVRTVLKSRCAASPAGTLGSGGHSPHVAPPHTAMSQASATLCVMWSACCAGSALFAGGQSNMCPLPPMQTRMGMAPHAQE